MKKHFYKMNETFPTLLSCMPLKTQFKSFQQIDVSSEEFTIGRGLHNALIIPFLDISINHCKFIQNNKNWIVEDYSTFGIFINGVKLGKGKRKQISHGDIIQLDKSSEFVYQFVNEDSELMPPSAKRIKLQCPEKVRSQLLSIENDGVKLVQNATPDENSETTTRQILTEVGEIMETELQCSICAELFVSATTLNCSHTFCKYCIEKWKQKRKQCPICRSIITSECRSLVLDSFIEKMVQNLTEEIKQKRRKMLQSREVEVNMKEPKTKRNTRVRRGSRNRRTRCPPVRVQRRPPALDQ
ncbi:E3 ubiquitin-protein ligase rnf8-A-like [Pararge aegeria]|uniref:E3 ubiquitin-protein ligase rnf8-A-like n=1 Tax=Pararge aegeria TaxID=116150 RepID=UPI0019D29027|nr:E3 ubiquitin-protein ligase rnf8-A-like [Pararge aegeria]